MVGSVDTNAISPTTHILAFNKGNKRLNKNTLQTSI